MKLKLFFLCLSALVWISGDTLAEEGLKNLSPAKAGIAVQDPIRTDTTLSPAGAVTAAATPNKDVEAVLVNQAIAAKNIRLNPRAVSFVQDYTARHNKDFTEMKEWGKPYFNLMENILVEHGLPIELKYLAVIESKLQSKAVSWAGAVGPWQFMPATAKAYGLKITKGRDERTDYHKSTVAAARYLKYLFNEFEDWLLVIAAYNGGPGYVYNAIKKSKSRNFWALQNYLPAESRNHVKKFISAHYIFEGQGGITTLTKAEATEQIGALAGYLFNRQLTGEELDQAATTTISGKYHSKVIAKYINMDLNEFNRYNPDFDKMIAASQNSYELKLPAEKMEAFVANKYPILNESVQQALNEGNTVANTDTMRSGNQESASAEIYRSALNEDQIIASAKNESKTVMKDRSFETEAEGAVIK
ncbi:MAG: transglycosylase SLT domain-containing protein [Chitinophagaceae bacterium]|nr:transglycosylase SLT domain-containing protein [Chitinophagaceae bacterium]